MLLAEQLTGDEISEPALWNTMRETVRVQVRAPQQRRTSRNGVTSFLAGVTVFGHHF